MLICPSFPVVDLYLVSSFFLNIFRYWEKKKKPTNNVYGFNECLSWGEFQFTGAGRLGARAHAYACQLQWDVKCACQLQWDVKESRCFSPFFFIFFLENYKKNIDYLHQRCK